MNCVRIIYRCQYVIVGRGVLLRRNGVGEVIRRIGQLVRLPNRDFQVVCIRLERRWRADDDAGRFIGNGTCVVCYCFGTWAPGKKGKLVCVSFSISISLKSRPVLLPAYPDRITRARRALELI